MQNNDVLIPHKKVIELTSLSASSIWREMKANRFPRNLKIGPNRVAWRMSDIEDWIASKVDAA